MILRTMKLIQCHIEFFSSLLMVLYWFFIYLFMGKQCVVCIAIWKMIGWRLSYGACSQLIGWSKNIQTHGETQKDSFCTVFLFLSFLFEEPFDK